jgi:trimethylamine:corrinoid methyltransferase-like protein
MFVNKMPRYEILSEDAMETLDRGWRRIVSELGVEFLLEESLEEFRKAGQKVEGNNVKLDPEFVLESSTSGRGTRQTRCTSAAITWSSRRSTGRRSCVRATCAATRRWRTSRTS